MRIGAIHGFPDENGEIVYRGQITTMAATIEFTISDNPRWEPDDEPAKRPRYELFGRAHRGGRAHVGNVYQRRSDAGQLYWSVQLDDPSWPRAMHAAAFRQDKPDGKAAETWHVEWNRPAPKREAAHADG